MKKIINPWKGLEGYLCFGCSPENPAGLHMEFYEDRDDIVAIWKPNQYMQGWLNTLHALTPKWFILSLPPNEPQKISISTAAKRKMKCDHPDNNNT